jgi:hypothetical protein
MRHLRGSTFDEYVEWYLSRERRENPNLNVPDTAPARMDMMKRDHGGKLRFWFEKGRWSVVLLEREEFANLIFHEDGWTRQEGLLVDDGQNYRLLGRVADRALESGYLTKTNDKRHLEYYTAFRRCHFRPEGISRLVICAANDAERKANPGGSFYLHDGTGRGLPYMILVTENPAMFEPVEAFLAQE